MPKTKDADVLRFQQDLLASIGEMKRGEFAAVHSPAQINARKRGRPAGTLKPDAKVSTTIRFDADVLAALKATGPGWQTRANDALRSALKTGRLKTA